MNQFDAQPTPAGGVITSVQPSLWRSPAPVRLLEALQRLALENGLVLAKQDVIAERSELSIRQIRRLLEVFERQGFLTRMRRGYQLLNRTSMAEPDIHGRTGHPWPNRTSMAEPDILRAENKGFPDGQKSVHKEERARVAAAAKKYKNSNKAAAAAHPSLAPIREVLKPYIKNSQRIGEMIFGHARRQLPDITVAELAALLRPEIETAFQRLQQGRITSLPGVLIAWSRDYLGLDALEHLREQEIRRREKQAREERERLEIEQAEAEELRVAQELHGAWLALPDAVRRQFQEACRAQLLSRYPNAKLWTPEVLSTSVEAGARKLWAEREADG